MGWERRPNKQGKAYFYRTIRVGHTFKRAYYGCGDAGHDAAAEIEGRRKDRLEAKKLLQDARNCTDEADKLANELREWSEVLLNSWLILTGHHKHHGQWRRKKHG